MAPYTSAIEPIGSVPLTVPELMSVSSPEILLKAVKINPTNPLSLDFIVDFYGRENEKTFKQQTKTLIKYFLAGLTVPPNEMWVNLNPKEPNRITTEKFGQTETGRDLLAQDYVLKQLSASLLSPENETGRKFWDGIYTKVYDEVKGERLKVKGETRNPLSSLWGEGQGEGFLNKIWIVPEKAVVVENGSSAFVKSARLKVMTERDYHVILRNEETKNLKADPYPSQAQGQDDNITKTIRSIIIPALEKEVNEGKSFAQLRQIYNSLILAAWYKRKILHLPPDKITGVGKGRVGGELSPMVYFVNQNKIAGVDIADKTEKQKIWSQYVDAFKKGVTNYIKEEYDPVAQQVIPRKYFTGGAGFEHIDTAMVVEPLQSGTDFAMSKPFEVKVNLSPINPSVDYASLSIEPRQSTYNPEDHHFISQEQYGSPIYPGVPYQEIRNRYEYLMQNFGSKIAWLIVLEELDLPQQLGFKIPHFVVFNRKFLNTLGAIYRTNDIGKKFRDLRNSLSDGRGFAQCFQDLYRSKINEPDFERGLDKFLKEFEKEFSEFASIQEWNKFFKSLLLMPSIQRMHANEYASDVFREFESAIESFLLSQYLPQDMRQYWDERMAMLSPRIVQRISVSGEDSFEQRQLEFDGTVAIDHFTALKQVGAYMSGQPLAGFNHYSSGYLNESYGVFLQDEIAPEKSARAFSDVGGFPAIETVVGGAKTLEYVSGATVINFIPGTDHIANIQYAFERYPWKIVWQGRELQNPYSGVSSEANESPYAQLWRSQTHDILTANGESLRSPLSEDQTRQIRQIVLNIRKALGLNIDADVVFAGNELMLLQVQPTRSRGKTIKPLPQFKPEDIIAEIPIVIGETPQEGFEGNIIGNIESRMLEFVEAGPAPDQPGYVRMKPDYPQFFNALGLENNDMLVAAKDPRDIRNRQFVIDSTTSRWMYHNGYDFFVQTGTVVLGMPGLYNRFPKLEWDRRETQYQSKGWEKEKASLLVSRPKVKVFSNGLRAVMVKADAEPLDMTLTVEADDPVWTPAWQTVADSSWRSRLAKHQYTHIIVADDNADFRSTMQDILGPCFHHIYAATSPEEVMAQYEKLKEKGKKDDEILILTDFQFADGENAFALINRLRLEKGFTGAIMVVSGSMVSELNIPGYDEARQDLSPEIKSQYGLGYVKKQPSGFGDALLGAIKHELDQTERVSYQKPADLTPLPEIKSTQGDVRVDKNSNLGFFLSRINDMEASLGRELEHADVPAEIRDQISFSKVRRGFNNGTIDFYAFRQSLHDHKNIIAALGHKIEKIENLTHIHQKIISYFEYIDWIYRMLIYCDRLQHIEVMDPLLRSAVVAYQRDYEGRQSSEFDPDEGIAQALGHLNTAGDEFRRQNLEPALIAWGILYKEYQAVEEGMNEVFGQQLSSSQNAFLKSFADRLNLFFGQYLMTFGIRNLKGDLHGTAKGRIVVLQDDDQAEDIFRKAVKEGDLVVVPQDYSWITVGKSKAAGIIFARSGGQHIVTQARVSKIPLLFLPNVDVFLGRVIQEFKRKGKSADILMRMDVGEEGRGSLESVDRPVEIPAEHQADEKLEPVQVDPVDEVGGPDTISSEMDGYADDYEKLLPWMSRKALNQYILGQELRANVPQFLVLTYRLTNRLFKLSDEYYEINDKISNLPPDAPQAQVEAALNEMREYIFSSSLGELDEIIPSVEEIEKSTKQMDDDPDRWKEMRQLAHMNKWIFETPLVIRLVTNDQDLEQYPGVGAGTYLSIENVRVRSVKELNQYLQKVYASLYSYEAYRHRQKHGIPEHAVKGAIEIQEYSLDATYSMHIETQVEGHPELLKIMLMPGAARSISSQDRRYGNEPFIFYYDKKQGKLIGWDDPRTQFHPVRAQKAYYASFTEQEPQSFNIKNYPQLQKIFDTKSFTGNLREALEHAASRCTAIEGDWKSPREIEATLGENFSVHQNRRMKGVSGAFESQETGEGKSVRRMEAAIAELRQNKELNDFFTRYSGERFDPKNFSSQDFLNLQQGLREVIEKFNDPVVKGVGYSFLFLLVYMNGGHAQDFNRTATSILEALQNEKFKDIAGPLMFLMSYFCFGGHEYMYQWLEYLSEEKPDLFAIFAPHLISAVTKTAIEISDKMEMYSSQELMLIRLFKDDFRKKPERQKLRQKFIASLSIENLDLLRDVFIRIGSVECLGIVTELIQQRPEAPAVDEKVQRLRTAIAKLRETPAINDFLTKYAGDGFDPENISEQDYMEFSVRLSRFTRTLGEEVLSSMNYSFLMSLVYAIGGSVDSFNETATDILDSLQQEEFQEIQKSLMFLIAYYCIGSHQYMANWLEYLSHARPDLFEIFAPYLILAVSENVYSLGARYILGFKEDGALVFRFFGEEDEDSMPINRTAGAAFIQRLNIQDIDRLLHAYVLLKKPGAEDVLPLLQQRSDFEQIRQLESFRKLFPEEESMAPAVDEKVQRLRTAIAKLRENKKLNEFFEKYSGIDFVPEHVLSDEISKILGGLYDVARHSGDPVAEDMYGHMFLVLLVALCGGMEHFNETATDIFEALQNNEFQDIRKPMMFLLACFCRHGHQYMYQWMDYLVEHRPDLFAILAPHFVYSMPEEVKNSRDNDFPQSELMAFHMFLTGWGVGNQNRKAKVRKAFIQTLDLKHISWLMEEYKGSRNEREIKENLLELLKERSDFNELKRFETFKQLYPDQDQAQLANGGIDLNTDKMDIAVETGAVSSLDQKNFDQALLASLKNMTGLDSIIVSIQILNDPSRFFQFPLPNQ
ncbi:MAG: response regulator [Candidatus Omnitrophica bacterium]|nr:response regulator [Candidatus Omnitrophota bacterium]